MPRSEKKKTNSIELFQQRLFDLTQEEVDKGTRDGKGRMTCTIRSIAAEIGISPSALSTWRQGKIKGIPQVDYLRKIAEHYHVNVDWLAGTPGVPMNPDTTLEATGLSAEAIGNLINIHNMFDEASKYQFGFDLPSKILSSPSFMRLVMIFMDLTTMAKDIETDVQFVESVMKSNSDVPLYDLGDFDLDEFILKASNLEYGRYSVFEECNNILDCLCKKPVKDTIARAHEVVRYYQKEMRSLEDV